MIAVVAIWFLEGNQRNIILRRIQEISAKNKTKYSFDLVLGTYGLKLFNFKQAFKF